MKGLRSDRTTKEAGVVKKGGGLCTYAGCEISTGPGTNASEMLVGPVKNLVYFHLN